MKKRIRADKIFREIYVRLYKFYGPRFWWPAKTRLEVIIGAILTQNTSWKNVEKAIKNLKKHKVLAKEKLLNIDPVELAELIKSSGYYNIKSGRLKNFITFLFEKYEGSLDKMFKEDFGILRNNLLAIKGLGEETVDSILLYAGQKAVFVIDAYTRRIFSRHRLIHECDSYQDIQNKFVRNLKSDVTLFNEYHALIVELGKNLCRKEPNCNACPLKDIPRR